MTDINSIIEMINKEVRPFAKTQHMDYGCGYDDACDDIIEQLRKMSDYALVPIEPTDAMLDEIHLIHEFSRKALIARYKAMLSAAPSKAL